MIRILNKHQKNKSARWNLILVTGLAFTFTACIFTFTKPATSIIDQNTNDTQLSTTYDYQATIKPNVLYPAGGTIPAGEAIIKKITTAIPVDLNTTVNSVEEVVVEGTHQVQMTLIAEDLWEKTFPLEELTSFEKKGTTIGIIDGKYKIDLGKINAFLIQVEEETGISPSKYTLEVNPNIVGTITYAGQKLPMESMDKLVFQFTLDSIVLSSEKGFASSLSFGTSEVMTNTMQVFGAVLSIAYVRLVSSILSLVLIAILVVLNKGILFRKRKSKPNQMDIINKKHSKRIIAVAKNVNIEEKFVITLTTFSSILAISDEKELPIFFNKSAGVDRATYFLIDGTSCYQYELSVNEEVGKVEKWIEGTEIYAGD